MFGYIQSLFTDPKATLMFILLAFPGRIMAICVHEYAHAWVADKCGDPTARYLGRLTLNPMKHLDVLGLVMMCLIGFGWAKPVPIDPRNYRNYRKDDLKVSLAGICMNLIMYIMGYLILSAFIVAALKHLPADESMLIMNYGGKESLISGGYYMPIADLFKNATSVSNFLITPVFGRMVGYVFTMISYFVQVNIVLAVFNLIPLPPLDGYHVLNDLLLHKPLFANRSTAMKAQFALLLLVFSGVLGTGLSYVVNGVNSGIGAAVHGMVQLIGLV